MCSELYLKCQASISEEASGHLVSPQVSAYCTVWPPFSCCSFEVGGSSQPPPPINPPHLFNPADSFYERSHLLHPLIHSTLTLVSFPHFGPRAHLQ